MGVDRPKCVFSEKWAKIIKKKIIKHEKNPNFLLEMSKTLFHPTHLVRKK